MYFVLITIICNVPTIFVQAYIGIGSEISGQGSDVNDDWINNLEKIDIRYLRILQFSCSLWLILLTISDPFTY